MEGNTVTTTTVENRTVIKCKILGNEKIEGPSDAVEAKSLFKEGDEDNEIVIFKCVNRYIVMNATRTKRMTVAKKKYTPDKSREGNLKTVMDADLAYEINDYDFFYKWVDDRQHRQSWTRAMRRAQKGNFRKMMMQDKERRQEELDRRGITYKELMQERINARNNRAVEPVSEVAAVQDGEVVGSRPVCDTESDPAPQRDEASATGV